MEGCHDRGVVSLSFHPDGDKLLSIGSDESHTHILWGDVGGNWSRTQQVCVRAKFRPFCFPHFQEFCEFSIIISMLYLA
jgi:WD40 repeat protein